MTLGVQVTAWHHHYATAMRPDGKLKRQAAQRNADSTAGPRGAAWSEGAGRAPPSVNAAKYGASYRVSRMNYDGSAEAMLQQQQQQQMQMQMQQQRANSNAGLLTNRSETPTGSAIPSAIPTQRPQGAIMSKTGEFLRYDPAAYRNAAMNSMGARMPMSFTPMQVQNMQTSADDPGQPGTMAITDGGSNY
ncbi:unnamed protein product [Symbiodinium natans]|uniref:Uncharacterized protein n=1 Tax=Symbiodinium natans TaxID=878477 RepID=A0A812K5H6_9DINO|nr:unnamed protein product [Symbiodinium natans]